MDLSEKSKFWEEFKILKDLEPHPHVLRLIGIVKSHHPTIVVEYCDGGDLRKYLTEVGQLVLCTQSYQKMFLQLFFLASR